jgi:hypothetical protein
LVIIVYSIFSTNYFLVLDFANEITAPLLSMNAPIKPNEDSIAPVCGSRLESSVGVVVGVVGGVV